MTKEQFDVWLTDNDYTTMNDWNFQLIDGHAYYWIKSISTGMFAFICQPNCNYNKYEVLVKDYDDFGVFHSN